MTVRTFIGDLIKEILITLILILPLLYAILYLMNLDAIRDFLVDLCLDNYYSFHSNYDVDLSLLL